ncbi:MAG: PRD domain-containing protein [Solobacterium sp.]|nr:PRD domain-containing protein [Solobacterium sp.]
MKVIKKINNNVAVCLDSKGNKIVAFGKGIGFPSMPYDLNDLSKVEHTFYGMKPENIQVLNSISKEYMDAAIRIVEYGSSRIASNLNPNLTFVLADHISFVIERTRRGMYIRMPNGSTMQAMYPIEMGIAKHARQYLNKMFDIHLMKDEEVSIAMHFIDAENIGENKADPTLDAEEISEVITGMIEQEYGLSIDRSSFNYGRFMTHLEYLIGRRRQHAEIQSENEKMFEMIKDENPKAWICTEQIRDMMRQKYKWFLNNEELLYLMLHINRMTSREIN